MATIARKSTDAEHIEGLLTLQHDLFGRLDDLSRRQAAFIRSDDTDRLLSLLGERQNLIDRIAQTNQQLEPYKARWELMLGEMPLGNRDRVRQKLDAVAVLAGAIAQRDDADRRELQQRRDATASELAKVSRARGAVAAYGGAAAGARFQDREA